MQTKTEVLSQILRQLDAEIGGRDVAILILQALIDTIENLNVKSAETFYKSFEKLTEIVKNTEPRFGVINYNFVKLQYFIRDKICTKQKCDTRWREMIKKQLEDMLKDNYQKRKLLLNYADMLEIEGKTILIHDHSHTVQDVLVHYKEKGQNFQVIIAEQEFEKTQDNIERMHDAKIPFQVVPAYMLSHVHEQIDMVFFGALTLKDNYCFVMSPGAHGIVSEFRLINVPIYLFIDSSKFSLWKSTPKHAVFMHKHERSHSNKSAIKYERVKYSHDRVPVELFDKIVTNEGVFTPEGVKNLFDEKMKKYSLEF